tara:strand:+ start:41 stop:478 length:438 start_codon:yes stop_codon:yes gene_type:complete
MDDSSEAMERILEMISRDPVYISDFKLSKSYTDISNYWNYWLVSNTESFNLLKAYFENKTIFNKNEKEELDTIFSAHFNSSDEHLILFYKNAEDDIFLKLKSEKVVNTLNIPYWSILLKDKEIKKVFKKYFKSKKKNIMNVMIFT